MTVTVKKITDIHREWLGRVTLSGSRMERALKKQDQTHLDSRDIRALLGLDPLVHAEDVEASLDISGPDLKAREAHKALGAWWCVGKHPEAVLLGDVSINHARYPWAVSAMDAVLPRPGGDPIGVIVELGREYAGCSREVIADMSRSIAQMDAAITGLKLYDVIHYAGGSPYFTKVRVKVKPDPSSLEAALKWRGNVLGLPGPDVELPAPKKASGGVRRATPEEQALMDDIGEIEGGIRQLKSREFGLNRKLGEMMGDAKGVMGSGAKALWRTPERASGLDIGALKAAHPHDWHKFQLRGKKPSPILETFIYPRHEVK